MERTINFTPVLSDSQLRYRIGLAEKRLMSFPLDNLDYICIDIEHPKTKHRQAHQCTTDLTGRMIEFISEAHELIPGCDDTFLDALFDRVNESEHDFGYLRRFVSYYKHSNDPEVYGYLLELGEKWLALYDKIQRGEAEHKEIYYDCGYDCSIEPLAFLYEITGDERYLRIIEIQLEQLEHEVDCTHSHSQLTIMRSLQAVAMVTGDNKWIEKVDAMRREIIDRKLPYADGSIAEGFPKSRRTEGCSTADWIILNLRHGFMNGDDESYELAEHALWNGLFFNQFVTGACGHREYIYRGYGTKIEEAWWCCTETAGLAMCEYARHAVQLRDGKIRINYLVPGVYTLNRGGYPIKVTVSTLFPEDFRSTIRVESEKDYELDLRIPYYVKHADVKKRKATDGAVIYDVSGRIGHYLEEREDGYSLKYGALMLAPLKYDWIGEPKNLAASETEIPEDYIVSGFAPDNCFIAPGTPDEDGFYDLSTRGELPIWGYYDDGPGAHLGTHNKAPANVKCKIGGKDKTLLFQPLCYATSALVLYNTITVFDLYK